MLNSAGKKTIVDFNTIYDDPCCSEDPLTTTITKVPDIPDMRANIEEDISDIISETGENDFENVDNCEKLMNSARKLAKGGK